MAEILKSPETANTKDLVASISREILNPEMAAVASSYESIDKKLKRKLKSMRNDSSVNVDL